MYRGDMMDLGKDVLHLIFLCEKLEREPLSCEEALLVRQCATELLTAIPGPARPDLSQVLIPF
jgi:hypothetical protein